MSGFRIALAGVFTCLAIYLFATAPEPLVQQTQLANGQCVYPAQDLFDGVNAINDVARSIYTKRIVGEGGKVGLKFGEDWQDPGVEKGPLPALFLRLTAAQLERKPPQLGLYLGSDAPINKSNLFAEKQNISFQEVKSTRNPIFSENATIGQVAMYPDVAGVQPCVSCHNEHPDSPKVDWKLGDVMGATTWTYPDAELSADAYLSTIEAMLTSVSEAYGIYLERAAGFKEPVDIGVNWPESGKLALPSGDIFMVEVRAAAAARLVDAMVAQNRLPAFGAAYAEAQKCAH